MVGLTCVSALISSHQSHPVKPLGLITCSYLQQIAAGLGSCSCFHFSLSLRFLGCLGVKYLQPVAANCSSCNGLPQAWEWKEASVLWRTRIGLSAFGLHFSVKPLALELQPVAASCSQLQQIAAISL
jgi:hypothetical protein